MTKQKSPFAVTVAQISFESVHELEEYLRKQGRRVKRWNVDGSFETEEIPISDDPGTARVPYPNYDGTACIKCGKIINRWIDTEEINGRYEACRECGHHQGLPV